MGRVYGDLEGVQMNLSAYQWLATVLGERALIRIAIGTIGRMRCPGVPGKIPCRHNLTAAIKVHGTWGEQKECLISVQCAQHAMRSDPFEICVDPWDLHKWERLWKIVELIPTKVLYFNEDRLRYAENWIWRVLQHHGGAARQYLEGVMRDASSTQPSH